ncbi:MAG: Rieske (2Fe-2S) protein [Alphaproteobacteria bacterium]|nr:Rieske (2Fe-2S) protein [Alphaproteobacteria bacterium]
MAEFNVGKFADIPDGGHKVFAAGGREVGVFRAGEKLFAWENHCPHAGGPICQGKIFNRVDEKLSDDKRSLGLAYRKERHIVCPWHGFEFDIATGKHPGDESVKLRGIPVKVQDGQVFLSFNPR